MNKVFAITPINEDPFIITWDLGRRCNYDCSYCPSHRHDNFSPHASLDALTATAKHIFEYISIISKHRINKDFHISFTGGEPTVNPDFIEFSEFLKKEKTKYTDKFNLKLSLTTNGAMSDKIADSVIDNFDYVTVSYHAETKSANKFNVIEKIKRFKESSIGLKVNVMMHAEHFEECQDLCETLKALDVKFIPRLIGDDPDSKSSQAHLYNEQHKEWLKAEWGIEISPTSRPCCGGRSFNVCSSTASTESKAVVDRNFKGWYCSVNWYFLHIEQQTGLVYHHQTCQAKFDNKKGSIATISEFDQLLHELEDNLNNNKMPVIVCPNNLCGCGLCTAKSSDKVVFLSSMNKIIKNTEVLNEF